MSVLTLEVQLGDAKGSAASSGSWVLQDLSGVSVARRRSWDGRSSFQVFSLAPAVRLTCTSVRMLAFIPGSRGSP
jgi:hypothetical protein